MEDPMTKYPDKPPLCQQDWGMHSCILPANHYEPHLCVCGDRKAQP